MNAVVDQAAVQSRRLKKAHLSLMRHEETFLYAGVILLGDSVVESGTFTAYTDGVNKKYCAEFISTLTAPELAAVVLHENLHVILKHILRGKDLMIENSQLANQAMDYAVNDIIDSIIDKALVKLPACGLLDKQFKGWSFRDIYKFLKKEQEEGGGKGRGDSLDEHDKDGPAGAGSMTPEEIEKLAGDIDEALRQGTILAGMNGKNVPRQIEDALAATVDWKDALREFVTSYAVGKDDYTWRKFNSRRLVDDLYMPSSYSEVVEEITVAIDTSGSIGGKELAAFTATLSDLCVQTNPQRVRVLWWDTEVHGEQIFTNNYENIRDVLKPQGGGGTRVGCVSQYMIQHNITPQCLVVLTDGYVESKIDWQVTCPTLWVVTFNKDFTPPSGQKVRINS
jgi:predicted metal-dependent peptidase